MKPLDWQWSSHAAKPRISYLPHFHHPTARSTLPSSSTCFIPFTICVTHTQRRRSQDCGGTNGMMIQQFYEPSLPPKKQARDLVIQCGWLRTGRLCACTWTTRKGWSELALPAECEREV